MKVLVLTKVPIDPPRDGGSLRVSAIREHLISKGHEVRVISARNNVITSAQAKKRISKQIRILSSALSTFSVSVLKWYSPSVVDQLVSQAEGFDPDVVLCEFPQLAPYLSLFSAPTIADFHNVESEIVSNYAKTRHGITRVLANLESLALQRVERKVASTAAGVAAVSVHDSQQISNWTALKPVVASNGVSEEAFNITCNVASALAPTVVFIGQLGWRPNIDASLWLANEVWPLVLQKIPNAELQLIGRTPAIEVIDLARKSNISVHGDVESVFPFLASASVATAPLWTAGGTRLKILEALATGTPVIATSRGALGLEHLNDDIALSITDDANEFADKIVSVIRHSVQPEAVRLSVSNYRWNETLEPLTMMVGNIAAQYSMNKNKKHKALLNPVSD